MRGSIALLIATFYHLQNVTQQQVAGFFVSSNTVRARYLFGSDTPSILSSATSRRTFSLHSTFTTSTETKQDNNIDKTQVSDRYIGSIAFLLPSGDDAVTKPSKFGIHSPVERPSYLQAAKHLASKAGWFSDDQVTTTIVTAPNDGDDTTKIRDTLEDANILIAMGLSKPTDMKFAESIFHNRQQQTSEERFSKCQFALDCDESSGQLSTLVGPFDKQTARTNPSLLFPWTDAASGQRFDEQMEGLFDRWTSDDFTVALMLFLNRFSGSPVNWVKDSADATWEKGPIRNAQELYQMATKCGDCLAKCLQDETCKTCLEKLTELDTRDQAASYRTIVSYESEALKDFSFCVFQKHNVFQCEATIPTIPKVTPMTKWRGSELTEGVARSLLIGHLDDDNAPEGSTKLDISWKVACGANVAYDQFPSQNQLFYEAAKGKDMWYDPVFRVETLDGRNVWCKRHYRVRNGPIPGTFRLSVLDNGVTSNEFWTIIGAADDLSWIAFHYAGAATSVGQRYLGGLLCTPDGSLPEQSQLETIWPIFQNAGIEPWELFVVNNDPQGPGALEAGPPPLDFYRKEVLASKEKLKGLQ
ncbi:hypothetical protein IV203_007432 [Nitzschia inconspicua]|uniref:VDE lipocalin domain-containing protein n=1 Tax=Nitzschia inconspicua TaxID=303405 RepID=A0A9K3KFH1_9STRA|nr:hypothetical protein IV203_007432 [Nitzschia inconspicua]